MCINTVNIHIPIHHFAHHFVLMDGGMVSEMLKMWDTGMANSLANFSD